MSTRPLKILHVCKALPHSYKSGIQTHVWKLTEWQLKMGHEVSILSAGSIKKGYQKRVIDGRIVHEIPYPPARFVPGIPMLLEEFLFNWFAKRWIKKNAKNYDVIHTQNRSGYLCAKPARKLGVPVVTTLHGMINLEYACTTEKVTNDLDRKLHTFFTVRFQKEQMAYSNGIIAVSNGTIKQVTLPPWNGRYLNKTRVVYNGIDIPKFDPTIEEDPNLMVFVGRVVAIKGLFPLFDAMLKVNPEIKLCIIGEGSAEKPLKDLIEKHGMQDRIWLTGPLDSTEVYEWIQKSAALILPSFYETHGIVLLEGNICGKPVLASNITGPDEVVIPGKNGWLFPPNDVDAMVDAINKLFADREKMKEMGAWGRAHVKDKFAWENVTGQTIDLYREVIELSKTNADLDERASNQPGESNEYPKQVYPLNSNY